MVSTLEQLQVQNGTGPGVRRSTFIGKIVRPGEGRGCCNPRYRPSQSVNNITVIAVSEVVSLAYNSFL